MPTKKIKKIKDNKKSVEERIRETLESVRPSLQADGGDIDFVGFDKKTGIANVKLVGHCAHCPMAEFTLKEGVEAVLKKEVPEVKKIINK